MITAGYVKAEKEGKKLRKIHQREPVHIKEILPDVMLGIRLRMTRSTAYKNRR